MKQNRTLFFLALIIFSILALNILADAIVLPSAAHAQSFPSATNTRMPRVTFTSVPPPTIPPPTTPPPTVPPPPTISPPTISPSTHTPTFKPRLTKTKVPDTATITPSLTETTTPQPTATFTVTFTATPTITPSPTFTFTPTATATAFPASVRLNELLSFAKFKDWNSDGRADHNDQWIEIHNLADHPADLSGWRIDTGEKTPVFVLPNGTTIPAGNFLILFRDETQLDLDRYNQIRLIHPDGSIADKVTYPPLDEDRVYARLPDGIGEWRAGCVPSPLTVNCQVEETYTSQFNLPFFKQHISAPNKSLDTQVLVTNLLLAILLALAIGFFSNLLNDTLETHEADVATLFGPLTRAFQKTRGLLDSLNKIVSRSRLPWLGVSFKLLIILFIYGTILAYLDPNFRFITQDSFMLILALGLSTGLIALADDLATYIYLRSRGANSGIRFHSGNFLLVALSTLVSRLTGLVPGLLLGSPAGIEDVPDEHSGPRLDILSIVITAILGFLAWALVPLFEHDPWMNTLLLLMFAAGVQTVFFEMIPLRYLRGKGIFQFNRLLWLALFVSAATAFLQTMLNPDGAFLEAFQSRNMLLLSLFVIAYCLFCTLVWLWLTRLARKREQTKPPADTV